MKICSDCGERVYNLGCSWCNEEAYIEEQDYFTGLWGLEPPVKADLTKEPQPIVALIPSATN